MDNDRKKWDIAKQLSTPRELCKTCGEWHEEDLDNPAGCSQGHRYECHDYLIADTDECPSYLEW